MSNLLTEEFQIHDQLNPKIWDNAGQLLPQVRQKVVEVVKQFEADLSVPIDIVDIQIVGSNAGYNYTENSDLDCHIIANFEMVSPEIELVKTLYDMKKKNFNDNHDISFYGINVELYVQDINSSCVSNGIYSVLDNKWIKEPKPNNSASKKNTEKEVEAWQIHIAKVIAEKNEEEILNAINTLYLIRHNAVAAEGEMSKGNQLFKEIRSLGLLDRLKEEYRKLVDSRLTLESLSEELSNGCLINRNILDEGMTYNCTCEILLPNDSIAKWESREYANSEKAARNMMLHKVHEKYGYKGIYIREIKVKL